MARFLGHFFRGTLEIRLRDSITVRIEAAAEACFLWLELRDALRRCIRYAGHHKKGG